MARLVELSKTARKLSDEVRERSRRCTEAISHLMLRIASLQMEAWAVREELRWRRANRLKEDKGRDQPQP